MNANLSFVKSRKYRIYVARNIDERMRIHILEDFYGIWISKYGSVPDDKNLSHNA
jgi:hypothetical protein